MRPLRLFLQPCFSLAAAYAKPMTKAARLITLGWLWMLAPLLAAVPPAPDKWLAENTLAFVTAPSWEAASAAFQQSSLGQLLADPAMRPFKERFQNRFTEEVIVPLEKEMGLNLSRHAELFQGQVTLALTATPPDSRPDQTIGFLFLADTGGHSKQLASLLTSLRRKRADAGKPLKQVRIHQTDLQVMRFSPTAAMRTLDKILPDPDAGKETTEPDPAPAPDLEWTLGQFGSLLLVSDSAKEMDQTLGMLREGGAPALADQKSYAADTALFAQAQVYGWVNAKAIMARLGRDAASPKPEGGTSVSRATLLQALGLGGVETIAFGLRGSAEGTSMQLSVRVPTAQRKGLFKILNLEAKDSGPPPFVPSDALKFSRLRLDLPRVWADLEATLAEVSPAAASFLRFMLNTAGKSHDEKFDLRQRLLARLGDDVVIYDRLPRGGAAREDETAPSVVVVGARNPEQTVMAVKAIADFLPPETTRFKEREFLGRTIYAVTLPRTLADGSVVPGTAWSYAAGGNGMAFSSEAAFVEDYLRQVAGAPAPLRERPGLAEAAQKVGGLNTGFFSYANTAESARAFFESARKDSFNAAAIVGSMQVGSWLGLNRQNGFLAWGDLGVLPAYERVARYFYLNVSTLNQDAEGYSYRFFAPTPPGLRK
jgi:hypothetical protein